MWLRNGLPRLGTALLLLSVLGACRPAAPPATTLSDERLVPLLVDMHLAESVVLEFAAARKDSLSEVVYQRTLAAHQVTKEEFAQVMRQLREDPQRLTALYAKVQEKLAEIEHPTN